MPLFAKDLQQRARKLAGFSLEDPEIDEPLQVLVDALNREARLTPAGEAAFGRRLVGLLANRLRMERDFRKHPEIAEQQVVAPIFILGLPRSGTTKMQKLLSVSGDFSELLYWMAFSPALVTGEHTEDNAPRIDEAEHFCRWMEQASPAVKLIHPYSTYEPEEVNPLLEQALQTLWWAGWVEIPSYVGWLMAQDPLQPMRYLRRIFQYLQWQFNMGPDKPWALKNPLFIGMEPIIRQVFPDAVLIMTHRHPFHCVASTISLQVAFHRAFSDVDINPPNIDVQASSGFRIMEMLAAAAKQSAANRVAFPHLGILDVGYGELTKNSMPVVKRSYRHIGKPLSDAARDRIAAWEGENRQHKHGAHQYSLGQYRLTEDMVSERFGEYIQDYGDYF